MSLKKLFSKKTNGFSEDEIEQIKAAFEMFDTVMDSKLLTEVNKRIIRMLRECSSDYKEVLEDVSNYSNQCTIKTIKTFQKELDIPVELAAAIYIAKAKKTHDMLTNYAKYRKDTW